MGLEGSPSGRDPSWALSCVSLDNLYNLLSFNVLIWKMDITESA